MRRIAKEIVPRHFSTENIIAHCSSALEIGDRYSVSAGRYDGISDIKDITLYHEKEDGSDKIQVGRLFFIPKSENTQRMHAYCRIDWRELGISPSHSPCEAMALMVRQLMRILMPSEKHYEPKILSDGRTEWRCYLRLYEWKAPWE
jgi:hypothetical protein